MYLNNRIEMSSSVESLLMIFGKNDSLQRLMDAEIFDDDCNFVRHGEESSRKSRINVPVSFSEVNFEINSTSAFDVIRLVQNELRKPERVTNVSFDLLFHADNGTETNYLRSISLSSKLIFELAAFNCSITINVSPGE
jgi:hypothetical protein